MQRRIGILLLLCGRLCGVELCPALKEALAAHRVETDPERKARLLRNVTEVERFSRCYVEFLHATLGFKDFLGRLEALRTDKQLGAGPSGMGGTSLVARGATARTLSLALEYGALTQSVTGQLVTFRGNLAGLPAALVRRDVFPYCDPRIPKSEQPGFCVASSWLGQLRRVSFGVSLDASRSAQPLVPGSSTDPATAVRPIQQRSALSGASIRYEIWNRRDVSSPAYQRAWERRLAAQTQVADVARRLSAQFEPVFEKLGASPAYAAWQRQTQERLAAAGDSENALRSQMARLAAMLLQEHLVTPEEVAQLRQLYSRYGFEQDELMELAAGEPVIAIEYARNLPLMQPPTSTLRLALDMPAGRRWSVALNTAVTFYDTAPPEVRSQAMRLKDVQFAAQAEHILGSSASRGPATLSAAVYYQYQNGPAILDGRRPEGTRPGGWPPLPAATAAERGSLALAQVRLTLGSPGGVRFPLAVTYFNRTELAAGPGWRAQLGVTYDFDLSFLP